MPPKVTLPELLRLHRRVAGLRMNELANKLGLSTATVYRNEHGERIPEPDEIQRYIEILQLDEAYRQDIWTAYNDTLSSRLAGQAQVKGLTNPFNIWMASKVSMSKPNSSIDSIKPSQYYSCFISYSSENEDFARQLYRWMQQARLRVWFAPEDMKGGKKIHEQIDQAIKAYEKLVLVLSEESIKSQWVQQELRRARRAELAEGRRKLFPIRLVDYEVLQNWECHDSRTGGDLAEEVRQYYIPDFSRWKDHDSFERAFARLLKDLQATEAPPVPAPRPVQSESVKSESQSASKVVAPLEPSVVELKRRRLRLLEERQAMEGRSTPPEIVIEIQDLRKELSES